MYGCVTCFISGFILKKAIGEGYIEDYIGDVKFRISPLSFYQVNPEGTELLYKRAKDYAELEDGDVLLDMYCGAGTIGLSMADKAKEIIGVEIIPEAIENAKENAARNGMTNAQFFCGDASDAGKILSDCGIRADAVVVDPPRKGLSEALIQTIADFDPEKIVYISCNPATLARDLDILSQKYSISTVTPVDMFPQTNHVECVALLRSDINL